ncbi:hypothetical protein P8452_39189 [Trifolium repens]|nr:hypothetical protein QL285_071623 [Trifolium repens]WJX53161.1 hypothetical protein P8452_39189 [Trifolium repens]
MPELAPNSGLLGSAKLTCFSKLALEWHNLEERSSSVEFHDLVKCTYWIDRRARKYVRDSDSHGRRSLLQRFTLLFKQKENPSNSPDIITFQATISIGEDKLLVEQEYVSH